MRYLLTASIAFAMMAGAATAQTVVPGAAPAAAPALKVGQMLSSADGKRVGRIDRLVVRDGTPVAASVIVDSRFVMIPVASISSADDKLATSLTRAEIRKLK